MERGCLVKLDRWEASTEVDRVTWVFYLVSFDEVLYDLLLFYNSDLILLNCKISGGC
jgi:hypothetical protein